MLLEAQKRSIGIDMVVYLVDINLHRKITALAYKYTQQLIQASEVFYSSTLKSSFHEMNG